MELRSRKLPEETSTPRKLPEESTTPRKPRASAPSTSTTPSTLHPDSMNTREFPLWQVIAGWMVHLYTATGLFVNMYSLIYALITPDFTLFARLNWLAILIDATDGTLARAVNIKKAVPGYDGALLDNIIDFQTFAVLPALAVVRFGLIEGEGWQFFLACIVLLASAYAFCQTMAKTTEAFVGFPSYWNIVVFYIYYLQASKWTTVIVFVVCGVISFVPVHFVYPTRTKRFFKWNLGGAYVWASLMLVPTMWPESRYGVAALYLSFVYVMYYVGISFYLDAERRKGLTK